MHFVHVQENMSMCNYKGITYPLKNTLVNYIAVFVQIAARSLVKAIS